MYFLYADFFGKAFHHFSPAFEILFPISGSYEILKFHLLEFPRSENEITGGNFISESFADLGNTEWQIRMIRVNNIFKIGENTLGRFRTQIRYLRFFPHPD